MIEIPISAIYVFFALVLSILGSIALVYFILFLRHARKFFIEVNDLISTNKDEMEYFLKDLPVVTRNMKQASEQIKDVTEVVTETTADFLIAKDNVKSNVELVSEVLMIVKKVFFKDL